MGGRILSAIVCLAILGGGAVAAPADEATAQLDLGALLGVAPQAGSPFAHEQLSRVVSARVRHTRLRPVRRSNARRIGRSLASLRPTWVTGLLRYAKKQFPKRDEVRAWRELRRIVGHRSPGVQFDVVLNSLQYENPRGIQKMMRRLRARLHPNGWFFDFLSSGFLKYPEAVKAAIAEAHGHGEWIGGNIFGLKKGRKLPAKVDFYSVQDHHFHLPLGAVRRLSTRKPILYHLNSNPHRPRSGGCRFMQRLNSLRRLKLIRRRAAQQHRYGFRVSYPALFPQCLISRGKGKGTFLRAYNAFRDPRVRNEIGEQLDRNDFDPST